APTRTGTVVGTPEYMAPEQAGDKAAAGPAVDVYALGAILYALLTGRPPFQAPSSLETLLLLKTQDPVPVVRLQPGTPRDLGTVCLKCLGKDPARRYASALDLVDDLRRFLGGVPVRGRPVGLPARASKWVRRRPAVAGLLLALVLVALTGFGLVTWQWGRAEDKATREEAARKIAQDREREATAARREVERVSALTLFDQATALCNQGDVGPGLLQFARVLETADRLGEPDLARVARTNLASWSGHVIRQRAELRQRGWVTVVAFSRPGGETAVTGGRDGTVRLWDAATGRPFGEPLRHDDPVWALDCSPVRAEVVVGTGVGEGGRGAVQLWDAGAGRPLWDKPPRYCDPVGQVEFSADGERVLVVAGTTAELRRRDDGGLIAALAHPAGAITAAFSPDGATGVTGGKDRAARFWDGRTGQPRGEPLAHRSPVEVVVFSPDGKVLATTNPLQIKVREESLPIVDAGEVRLWDVATRRPLSQPLAHPKPVRAVALSPAGRRLLTGCEDHNARLFDVPSGAPGGR
ncbi:MAG TPA: hypothetical protein VFW33_04745, partial [Gemmataceae bacterium]|nr:hypothetical protein [Gemmataceae bacterium]